MEATTNKKNPLTGIITDFTESSLTDKIFTAMLIFVPIAIILYLLDFAPLLVFVVSGFAVIPLAKAMSDSTELLAEHSGPAIGGLLNATFGNAVELIIAVLALIGGLSEVVKASITGSIIGNLLLVMGMAMFIGGLGREKQKFNRVSASASASQLFLAAIALIIPAVFQTTVQMMNTTSDNKTNDLLETLSLLVAGILLISYVGQLIFFLVTHPHLSTESSSETATRNNATGPNDTMEKGHKAEQEDENNRNTSAIATRRKVFTHKEQKKIEERKASNANPIVRPLITLLIATVVVGVVSEILVDSIEPVTKQLGWTELFVGVILLAVVGNAAEYVAAISAAKKNRMNLSVNIAIGSSLQMIFFVTPVLVFVGLLSGNRLNLAFNNFELISILVTILILSRVVNDGESNWLEGMQLIGAYLIIAVAFFLHP